MKQINEMKTKTDFFLTGENFQCEINEAYREKKETWSRMNSMFPDSLFLPRKQQIGRTGIAQDVKDRNSDSLISSHWTMTSQHVADDYFRSLRAPFLTNVKKNL